jgi:hypothetical protein
MNFAPKKGKFIPNKTAYEQSKSSFLHFIFSSIITPDCTERLKRSTVQSVLVDEKAIYTVDDYFTFEQAKDLREFSLNCEFAGQSYGSVEAAIVGEKPSLTMDPKIRWSFFFNPPLPIFSLYDFLSYISLQIDCEITTMPWDLFDGVMGSPATIANKVFRFEPESMKKGIHKDYDPSQKLPFKIPCLYADDPFSEAFINGEAGKPYLLTLMLYSTAENFHPHYEMGTVFYTDDETKSIRSFCKDMRMVIFEGDIKHNIAASAFEKEIDTWRVSYVYKLIFNPKGVDVDTKQRLCDFFKQSSLSFQQFADIRSAIQQEVL